MTEASNLKPITAETPNPAQRLSLAVLRRWWLVAFALSLTAIGSGTLAVWLLMTQPAKPNCDRVLWIFASASMRIQCAQDKARQNNLEDLFEAIALVDGLPQNHPLRPLINRWVELWAKQALDLAEEEFHGGNLERAVYFAEKIPAQTTAHAQVKERVQRWKQVWAKGQKIFDQANAALKDEDWRKAFSIMVGLLFVDNRYWSQVQYESLNQTIITAQKDETQLVEAQRLLVAGGIDNLTKALSLLQNLSKDTIFKQSVDKTTTKIARSLMAIAEAALDRQDLTTALNALEQIPRNVSFWAEVQDWTDIANAMADTWAETIQGYEAAIARLKKMSPDRPLYTRAQAYIERWTVDIGYVRLLDEARARAADGSISALASALAQARQIPSSSAQWKAAQQDIQQWAADLSSQQDQPILNRADELSFKGDPASLRAAIQEAQRIAVGTPLYTEAQSRIKSWQSQLNPSLGRSTVLDTAAEISTVDQPMQNLLKEAQQTAQSGTPAALASAIETANQIPVESTVYTEAQDAIISWGDQMLELAKSRANYDLQAAIAIAQQIPTAAPAYGAAQQQIQAWQTATSPQPSAQPSQ